MVITRGVGLVGCFRKTFLAGAWRVVVRGVCHPRGNQRVGAKGVRLRGDERRAPKAEIQVRTHLLANADLFRSKIAD